METSIHFSPWQQHSKAVQPAGVLPFLEPRQIEISWAACGLAGAPPGALLQVAGRISAHPTLSALVWHLHWTIFLSPHWTRPPVAAWPTFENEFGEEGHLVYLLLALSWEPLLQAVHRQWGIDPQVTRGTAQQVSCFVENCQRGSGRLGVFPRQMGWLRNYLKEPYVRLGRLEYWYKTHHLPFAVFKAREGGGVLTLAESGMVFDGGGRAAPPGATAGREGYWESVLTPVPGGLRGHPISRKGRVSLEPREIRFDQFDRVLEKGSPILELHIPAGGGLSPEIMVESFREAEVFFKGRYPMVPPVAITTSSWMFSPDLPEILPPTSNLLKLWDVIDITPMPCSGPEPLWFIFLQDPLDLKTAPRDTSLQRALLGHLEKGNPWRSGGMFRLL